MSTPAMPATSTLTAADPYAAAEGGRPDSQDVEDLRRERDLYLEKLQRVSEAIGSDDPMRVVHDVRNVMNELVLLRKLVDLGDDE